MAGTAMMTDNWKQVFPDCTTIEGSCLFIKKLIAVSLSAITYVRGIFPEKAYGNKDLNGVKLKILREDCGLKSVKKFIDLVRNCYDAVEKNYLQQLCIGVVPDPQNREEIVELYNLVFRYKDEEYSLTCNGENRISSKTLDPVKEATLLMLKNAVTICDMLGPLPKNAYLTMKLLYYDDVTPPDYEPLGFVPCQKEKFDFIGETMKIQLGKIDTDAHGFKSYLKTTLGQNLTQQWEENSILNTSQSSNGNIMHNEEEPVKSPKLSQGSQSGIKTTIKEPLADCPCKCKTDNLSNTIQCLSCGRKQHTVCYAILNIEDTPTVFYCADCMLDNTDGDSHLDLVYTLPKKERENLCLMRRALVFCTIVKVITSNVLEKKVGFSKAVATKIIERMESEGFIKKSTRNRYSVNESNIRNLGFEKYFPDKDKENVDTEVLQNDFSQPEFDDLVYDHGSVRPLETSNYDPDDYSQTDIIENSISQVRAMTLDNDLREKRIIRHSQERKPTSMQVMTLDNDLREERIIRHSQERKPTSMQVMTLDNDLREEKMIRLSQERKPTSVRSSASSRSSQKRKLSTSDSLLNPDNSEELFQSSASVRVKKPRKAKH